MCCKSLFVCPVCQRILKIHNKNYTCAEGHSFDAAKSGYINLLTSDRMNTKNPGDNKSMVRSRSEFLEKGYYAHLLEKLSEVINNISKEGDIILDAGCGEGYYTSGIAKRLFEENKKVNIAGIDISKYAVDKAAKRNKNIEFAVSSVFHMPVADEYCDILLNIFAPFCHEEYLRVLKSKGYLVVIIPDRNHLWELKKIVYKNPYVNNPKSEKIECFEFLESISVKSNIFLESNSDIVNLFAMTPYFYNTSMKDKEKLLLINTLETQTEFEILIYRKKENENGT